MRIKQPKNLQNFYNFYLNSEQVSRKIPAPLADKKAPKIVNKIIKVDETPIAGP